MSQEKFPLKTTLAIAAIALIPSFGFAGGASKLGPKPGTYSMPLTCSELMPDIEPFLQFIEAVAKGNVASDKPLSKRIFKLIALREKLSDTLDRTSGQNPVDVLIRKTLCFYREQKEPVRLIPYDDPTFLTFLKASMPELEQKVDDSVFQVEFERQQRKEYERQLEKNQALVESVKRQADVDADRVFEKLSTSAQRKVKSQ